MGELINSLTVGQIWGALLAFAAAIVAISKAWDVINSRLKPQRDLKAEVHRHGELLAKDKDAIEELRDVNAEQKKANAVFCRALFAQINHELSGNGNDILRQSREELQKYLTDR